MLSAMFAVTEAEAAAIRAAFEQGGEFAAAVELRRLFPGVTDNAEARECAHHRWLETADGAGAPRQVRSAGGRQGAIGQGVQRPLMTGRRAANGVIVNDQPEEVR
jgi:hypothetical protein